MADKNMDKLIEPFKKAQQSELDFTKYIDDIRPALKREFKKKFDELPTKTVTRAGRKVTVIDNSTAAFNRFVLSLPKLLKSTFDKVGYSEKARLYVANFDLVEQGNAGLLDDQNSDRLPKSSVDRLRSFMEAQTLSYLAGDDMTEQALFEVKKALQIAGLNGSSYLETVDNIGDILAGDNENVGKFGQIATLVARDSIYQYNGMLNEEASRQFGYNAYRYIGSLVDESRPQCERWIDKEYILFNELEDEIAWAFDNGSGMNPATAPDNFAIYRGGYNCRHIAVPTFYEPTEADQTSAE